jgi:AmiR/NasT family two-component response regulator
VHDESKLRILVANESSKRLTRLASLITGLGHEVVSREVDIEQVATATRASMPDVAFVGLGESSEHALALISEIVKEAACPVIALLPGQDPDFVKEAAKRGIFAYITDRDPAEWDSSLDIVLRRFTEYHNLDAAFARRALIERAKGILMERHALDEGRAFELLRAHSRRSNRRLVEVARSIAESHLLLPSGTQAAASRAEAGSTAATPRS